MARSANIGSMYPLGESQRDQSFQEVDMRILHIGYRLPPEPGGKERYIERLAREQLIRGHEAFIARRRGEMPRGAETLPLTRTRISRAVSRKSDVIAFAMECSSTSLHKRDQHHPCARRPSRGARPGLRCATASASPLGPRPRALTMRHRRIMPWGFPSRRRFHRVRYAAEGGPTRDRDAGPADPHDAQRSGHRASGRVPRESSR